MRSSLKTGVAVVCGVAIGSLATLGVALMRDDPGAMSRPTAEDSAAPMTVPLTSQVLSSSEILSGEIAFADFLEPVASSGIVTATPLDDGEAVVNGDVIIEINDLPKVALTMRFGLWRELRAGDVGADVREVLTAMKDLGLYDGDVAAPLSAGALESLATIDPRLGASAINPEAIVPIDAAGSTLTMPGVDVGTRLGELSVGVKRVSHQLAVDDGGMAAEFVEPGFPVELFGKDGSTVWSGTVSKVETRSSMTILSVTGDGELPAEFSGATVVTNSTPGDVLAVPRVAIAPQPDGASTVTLVDEDGRETRLGVRVGLCTADLCQITPTDDSGAKRLVDGALVEVL